jgi:hypothetical protein
VIFHSYVSVPEGIIHHRQYSSLERFEQNHLIAPEMLKCIFYINIYCVCVHRWATFRFCFYLFEYAYMRSTAQHQKCMPKPFQKENFTNWKSLPFWNRFGSIDVNSFFWQTFQAVNITSTQKKYKKRYEGKPWTQVYLTICHPEILV